MVVVVVVVVVEVISEGCLESSTQREDLALTSTPQYCTYYIIVYIVNGNCNITYYLHSVVFVHLVFTAVDSISSTVSMCYSYSHHIS